MPGVRLVVWVLLGVPGFAAGWATLQTMGEVVGEAWGGAFLHALGHTAGTVLLVALLSGTGLLAMHGHLAWATRWAAAGTLGATAGFVAFVPVLAYAPDSLVDLHPVWDKAVEYWWRMVPTGLLGGVVYVAVTAVLVVRSAPAPSSPSTARAA